MGESSLRLEFAGRNEDGEVAFTGVEQHVCVPTDEDEAIRPPDGLRQAIEEFDANEIRGSGGLSPDARALCAPGGSGPP